MMTRIVKLLFLLGVALLIACLVAPGFIDWNQHKAEVMAQIEPYFKRKVDVAGNISFKVLPQPEITLESVTIANAEGSKEPSLITLKSLEARIRLEPLLEGRIEVENINLTQPVLNLEVSGDGKTNLSGLLAPSADLGAAASAVQLNQVSIADGTLHYSNQLTGTERTFDNLNLSVKADTLLGPYKIVGDMQYQKTRVNIDMDTGVFDKAMSAPAHLTLLPADDNLPQVKISGDLDLQSGVDMAGEISVSQGKLGGLVNIASLNALDFMNDAVDMTGTVEFKGDQFTLNDIKAKFGKDGTLRGKLSVQFSHKGNPTVQADLEGTGLTVTSKPSDTYMNVPADYQGSLRFKGKNIIWDGRHLDTADISTTFNDKDWTIKSALISLPGNTQIKLAGTVTPKTNSAAYTAVQITTEDLGQMVSSFAPADTSIFSALDGAAAPFKKLQMTSDLEISPAKISFFNIDATVDDKEKVSGVLNVERVTAKQNVTAKLHLSGWDSAAFTDGFIQALMKSDADLELTADNFTRGAFKAADLSFKGKTDGQGLAIEDLSGHLSDKDTFSVSGHVAALTPAVTGLDVSYTMKAAHAADAAGNLGADLPPLNGENFDVKGNVKGDAGKYTYTAQGSSDELVWHGQHIAHPSFSVEATPSVVKVSGLTGTVWGGKLAGDIVFTAQVQPAPSWSSTFKGSLKQADLQKLQDQLGFKGFTTGAGDVDFDLASADNTPNSATGSVVLQASSITIEKFNADKLADTLHQLTSMPDNLQQVVDDALRKNGSSVFKDVQGKFKIDHGKVSIETLSLSNATEKLALAGSADIPAGSYTVSGDLQLAKPAGFPALKIQRTSISEDYKVDSKPLENYVIKNLPPPPPAVTPTDKPAPVAVAPAPPDAPAAQAPAPNKDQSINDILKHLDDSNAAAPPAPAAPVPAKPPQPPAPAQSDLNKMLQQMQMQDIMQQDNNSGMPMPLTPLPAP
jgi:hypothetical protein